MIQWGSQIRRKNSLFMHYKPFSHNCSNPMHVLYAHTHTQNLILIWKTECLLIKGYKQSHLHSISHIIVQSQLSEDTNFDFDSCQPGVSGSSWPVSGFSWITSLLTPPPSSQFICMWAWPYFAAQYNVAKDNAENSDLFFHCHDNSSKSVPSMSSELVDIRPPTQAGE